MSAPAPSLFSSEAKQVAQSLGLKMGRANLDVFADTLLSLARANRDVYVVTSDSRGSGKLGPFGKELPEQIIELGIAEQNLVGVAAGLASTGKIVYAVSPACFLAARSFEQIKNDVCYSDNPVKLIGISAGVSYGALGTTHHSLHDLAALRAVNNLDIVVPADNIETRQVIEFAAAHPHPMYLRFGKAAMYDLLPSDRPFVHGKASVLREGNDVAFLATGETVIHALLAAKKLESHGLSARVISVHSIKPLDVPMILDSAKKCSAVITVEEHLINGGLGEAVATVLLESGYSPRFKRVAIPDEYTVTGSQADIFRHYGISMEGLTQSALELLHK